MPPPAFLAQSGDSSQQTTYSGNCHCTVIRFTVTIPRPLESSPSQITQCNCSICGKNGLLNVHGQLSSLNITHGKETLSQYNFGKKNVSHKFCKTCGSSLFIVAPAKLFGGDGDDIFAVNIRMLKDVDFENLETKKFDGWNKGFSGAGYEC